MTARNLTAGNLLSVGPARRRGRHATRHPVVAACGRTGGVDLFDAATLEQVSRFRLDEQLRR